MGYNETYFTKIALSSIVGSLGIICLLLILASFSGAGYLPSVIESIWFYFIAINTTLSVGLALCLYFLNSIYHFFTNIRFCRLRHYLVAGMLYALALLLVLASASFILDLESKEFFDEPIKALIMPILYVIGGLIGGALLSFVIPPPKTNTQHALSPILFASAVIFIIWSVWSAWQVYSDLF